MTGSTGTGSNTWEQDSELGNFIQIVARDNWRPGHPAHHQHVVR